MGNSKPRPATTWRSRSAGWATEIATGSAAGPGPRACRAKRLTLLVPALLASASALADPGYYLVTVYDNQGQYDIDVALHTLLVRNDEPTDGRALEFGPALQTELDRFRLNANLFFEKSWGRATARPVQLKYQWQVNYRWRPAFQFGLQGFGELGEWDRWLPSGRQSHRLGPVVSGALPLGAPDALHDQFAYLDGKIYGRPGHMLSMRLNYTF